MARRNDDNLSELLSAYIDDELGDAEAARVEAHLAENREARTLLDDLRRNRDLLVALPRGHAPDDLRESIVAQLERSALLDEPDDGGLAGAVEPRRWHLGKLLATAAMFAVICSVGVVIYKNVPALDAPALLVAERGPAEPQDEAESRPRLIERDPDTTTLPAIGVSVDNGSLARRPEAPPSEPAAPTDKPRDAVDALAQAEVAQKRDEPAQPTLRTKRLVAAASTFADGLERLGRRLREVAEAEFFDHGPAPDADLAAGLAEGIVALDLQTIPGSDPAATNRQLKRLFAQADRSVVQRRLNRQTFELDAAEAEGDDALTLASVDADSFRLNLDVEPQQLPKLVADLRAAHAEQLASVSLQVGVAIADNWTDVEQLTRLVANQPEPPVVKEIAVLADAVEKQDEVALAPARAAGRGRSPGAAAKPAARTLATPSAAAGERNEGLSEKLDREPSLVRQVEAVPGDEELRIARRENTRNRSAAQTDESRFAQPLARAGRRAMVPKAVAKRIRLIVTVRRATTQPTSRPATQPTSRPTAQPTSQPATSAPAAP